MLKKIYETWVTTVTSLQDVFLLAIRLYWGYQFMITGWGKFTNWDRTVGFFTELGIPAPQVNVAMAAGTEFLGGLCLLLGLGGRIATVPLIFTMIVAYSTAHIDAVKGIFEDPDTFVTQPPFLFLMTAVIVLLFGAGKYSVDRLLPYRS